MCQVFDPAYPVTVHAPVAWPDDPHGRYAGMLSKDGRDLHFTLTLEVRSDGLAATLDIPALGIVAAPFAAVAYEPPTLVLSMSGVAGDSLSWIGTVEGDGIAGHWTGAGIDATFEMSRCPIEPACFTVQEIACDAVAGRLAGSLIRPLGVGPHPAALHLPGPGATTRDESRYLAQFLARHGVASLILDAPGAGQSTGDYGSYGLEEQARDAVAGIRLLRAADGIDPARAGIVAGSLAGWAAPIAACLLGDLAFLVLRSAPMLTPAEQERFEADARLASAGYDRVERARLRNLLLDRQAAMRAEPAVAELGKPIPTPIARPWLREAGLGQGPRPCHDEAALRRYRRDLDFDPTPLLKALDVPVLALYGERDGRLPVLSCAEALVALRRRDGRDVTVHVFPDTGHGLIQAPPPGAPFDWPRLPAGYLPVIAAWLQTRVLRPA